MLFILLNLIIKKLIVTIVNTDKILTIHPIWMVQDSCLVNTKDNGRQRIRK